jgi:hypothetical protein
VLAPNPHNRQPWIAGLPGAAPDTVVVRCDLDRRLPVTDPFDLQIAIGLGASVELCRLAAAEEGRAVAVTPFPEGEPGPRPDRRPVAVLRLGPPASATPDPLFRHAATRRSNKRPFDTARAVEPATLAALHAATGAASGTLRLTAATEPVAALRDLAWRGLLAESGDRAAWMESVALMRIGEAEIAAKPDGIALRGPGIDAGRAARAAAVTAATDAIAPIAAGLDAAEIAAALPLLRRLRAALDAARDTEDPTPEA